MALTNVKFADLITFTRSGATATRVNSAGLIESVAANTPRFDYDPVTLEPKGLLIEEARTNLLLRSEEFDSASWVKSNASVTADSTAAPDGATTGDTLTASAASGELRQDITLTANTGYCFSVFLKAGTSTQSRLIMFDVTGADTQANATIAWSAGVPSVSSSTYTSSEIVEYGNGWYRFIGTWTSDASNTSHRVILRPDSSAGTGTIIVWGAQLEAGSYATSYIPTTTATVTRNADDASITGTAFSDWFNASEGTMYAEFSTFGLDSQVPTAFSISDGTSSERLEIRAFLTSQFVVIDGGAAQAALDGGTPTFDGATMKCAGAFAANDFASCLNGGTVATDTSGTLPTVDRARIGTRYDGAGSFQVMNGHIKDIRFYPSRLSNTELQDLTS